MNEHGRGEDDEVQPCQGFGQALAATRYPSELVEPVEAVLNHPTTRQRLELFFQDGLMICNSIRAWYAACTAESFV